MTPETTTGTDGRTDFEKIEVFEADLRTALAALAAGLEQTMLLCGAEGPPVVIPEDERDETAFEICGEFDASALVTSDGEIASEATINGQTVTINVV